MFKNQRRLLDPKLDVVFEAIFTDPENSELLRQLVQDFLQLSEPIRDIEVLNPKTRRIGTFGRGAIVDLLVTYNDGERAHIDIQLRGHGALVERTLLYWARAYAGQVLIADGFEILKPTTGIFILDYKQFLGSEYYSVFRLLEQTRHTPLTDAMALHYLELPKIPRKLLGTDASNPMLRWGAFFKARTAEELHGYAMKDPLLATAEEALGKVSEDRRLQEFAYKRALEVGDFNAQLRAQRKNGVAEGEARGEATALRATLMSLCQAFDITLTPERKTLLDAADGDLQALIQTVAETHSWPE